jgi:predicted ABC-class ATPase
LRVSSDRELRSTLTRIDGRGYKAYKDIRGTYRFDDGTLLAIDRVQGDPFAAPSRVRVRLPAAMARLPHELIDTPVRRLALEDHLARRVRRAIRAAVQGHRGSGKSGMVAIDAGGQQVIARTAVRIDDAGVEARLAVGLPAAGRKVLGRQAADLLLGEVPDVSRRGLAWDDEGAEAAREFVAVVENLEHLRGQLAERGLVAFVGDGASLPRRSGASDAPLTGDEVVRFEAPESLSVELELAVPSNGRRTVRGMGIPRGVTLIVGGGYHGKSTLLRALERGVYPHVPGDGRELVVSDPSAFKIRAEDGRRVESVDISPFISELPGGRSTEAFRSDDASGSTSQAANIVEAVEAGSRLLLLDEDTSATNFMIRDARMQELVHKRDEPITPFLERVRELYERLGVSTVLVMGGSGDYFDVADTVIAMRSYRPQEVTANARRIAAAHTTGRAQEAPEPLTEPRGRVPVPESFDPSRGKKSVKIDAKGLDLIAYGEERIDLRQVEQLVDLSQTRAIGLAIHFASRELMDSRATLRDVVDRLDEKLEDGGLDELDPFARPGEHPGELARPRKFEIAAAINRLRTVRMR